MLVSSTFSVESTFLESCQPSHPVCIEWQFKHINHNLLIYQFRGNSALEVLHNFFVVKMNPSDRFIGALSRLWSRFQLKKQDS